MYSFTSPNWFVLNPVFCRVCRVCSLLCCAKLKQTAERCILFFFLFYKKAKIIFLLFMYTNKSRLFTIPIIFMTKRSCFHCWKGNKSSLSSFKHSTKCSLFIIIIKTTGQTWKKHTAQFKYVVKSVPYRREVMQNILFYVDIVRVKVNNILAFKYREYGNIWFCVEGETQHWFQFCFSLK